jgi:hypothetical protein
MPLKRTSFTTWLGRHWVLIAFAAVTLLFHLSVNAFGGYGVFRDELYYIACSDHPDIGYVDQPPLSLWILAVSRLFFGDSLFALRLLPAVTGAASVVFTGLLARELGGGKYAQALACLAALVALFPLAIGSIFSMNCFGYLFWAIGAYLVARLIVTNDPKYWIAIGIVIGLGALNKIDAIWLGVGVYVGILTTSHRHWFRTGWPWWAALIAFLLFLPYIVWNFTHDFAHLEFIHNATAGKYSTLDRSTFIVGQFFVENPVTAPLWLLGLAALFLLKQWKQFRPLVLIYIVPLIILLLNGQSKPEYLSTAYTVLFAAGGAAAERLLTVPRWIWLRIVLAVLLAAGMALAPTVVPVLPVDTYIQYAEALGIKPTTAEAKDLAELPQFFADMFGWEEKAKAVAEAYTRLSPEEKEKCAIFADNYGRCGAIDFFGNKYGLPRSIGRHNNYWLWGPRGYTGELMMILGGRLENQQASFEEVEIVGHVTCTYCMPYENNLAIYLCRRSKVPLEERWKRMKVFE